MSCSARRPARGRRGAAAPHVLVAPSVPTKEGKREGIPVVLMEAMSSGLPVVASDISGIPELVVHEVAGLLTPRRKRSDRRRAGAAGRRSRAARAAGRPGPRARVEAEFDVERSVDHLLHHFPAPGRRMSRCSCSPGGRRADLLRVCALPGPGPRARAPAPARAPGSAPITPTVSVVIAAHEEGGGGSATRWGGTRLDYAADGLQLLIASDGSTDGTVAARARGGERGRWRARVLAIEGDDGRGELAGLRPDGRRGAAPIIPPPARDAHHPVTALGPVPDGVRSRFAHQPMNGECFPRRR